MDIEFIEKMKVLYPEDCAKIEELVSLWMKKKHEAAVAEREESRLRYEESKLNYELIMANEALQIKWENDKNKVSSLS